VPSQVSSVVDLEPGTWLIAEVDGSIGVKIGAQYGYDYNWIRKVDLGSLSGDVGLKIQAAVDATVGFDASGKYLVVVARESLDSASKIVRVQIFKMVKKGWDFAFNASAGVTGSTGALLPAQIDDFVAAVFGVHGAQIVEDLKQFDQWTDPSTPLPGLLSGFVSDFATKELSSFAGTAIQQLQAARQKIADFLSEWQNLGHSTSTWLWSQIQSTGGPVAEVLDFLNQTNGLDDAGLQTLIETELGKVGFTSSPIGTLIESVTSGDVLTLLNSSPLLAEVRTAATTALSILNGQVLSNLVQFVGQKLDISEVDKIVSEADFDSLDPWLKAKLAKFLGEQTVLFTDLDTIRATLKAIRDKAGDLYQQAVKALNNTYTAAFHYTYSKSTTSTALVDVSFDFVKDPAVGAFMKIAIQGDFTDLLTVNSPGMALKSGTLTHGVKRQSHVQIVLPYFSDTIDHINTALASVNLVEDKGRLYALQATDTLVRAHKWASDLTITGKLSAGAGVNIFVTGQQVADSMTFAYGFRQALNGVRDVHFEDQLQPLVDPYFSNAFGGPATPAKTSLPEWIADLDSRASAIAQTPAGSLGSVLLSLDVSLPGKVVAAWFNAPSDPKADAYLQMSRNIQTALRRFTQFCYFSDPTKYGDIAAAPAVFVYGCLPVSTNVSVNGDGTITLNLPTDIYWDFPDPDTRQNMVAAARSAVASRMAGIRQVLLDPGLFMTGRAGFYDAVNNPSLVDQALSAALTNPAFQGLLFTEAQTITQARQAGLQLAKFGASAGTDPQAAIQAIEDFGAKITDAFNRGLSGLIPHLEEFSAMIFLEAARAFDAGLAGIRPAARLDVFLLKPSAPATVADAFLSGTAPDNAVVTIEQPVVGLP
jgi:hypothetical protein